VPDDGWGEDIDWQEQDVWGQNPDETHGLLPEKRPTSWDEWDGLQSSLLSSRFEASQASLDGTPADSPSPSPSNHPESPSEPPADEREGDLGDLVEARLHRKANEEKEVKVVQLEAALKQATEAQGVMGEQLLGLHLSRGEDPVEAHANRELAGVYASLNTVSEKLAQANGELGKLSSELDQTQAELEDANAVVEKQDIQLAEFQVEYDKAREKTCATEVELGSATKRAGYLEEMLDAHGKRAKEEISAINAAKEAEEAKLQDAMMDLEARNLNLQSALESKEAALFASDARFADMCTANQEALSSASLTLGHQCEEKVSQAKDEAEKMLREARLMLATERHENSELTTRLAAAESAILRLHDNATALQEEKKTLATGLEEQKSMLIELEAAVEVGQVALEESMAENEESRAMLQEWLVEQQRWQKETKELETKQKELTERLVSAESTRGESEERDRRVLQTERDRRKDERARGTELREALEAKLEQAEAQIHELTARNLRQSHESHTDASAAPVLEPGLATPGISHALREHRVDSLELELESLHADLESRCLLVPP